MKHEPASLADGPRRLVAGFGLAVALLVPFLPAGAPDDAEAKPRKGPVEVKVVKLRAPSSVEPGKRYVVSGRLANRAKARRGAVVKVSLSPKRKAGKVLGRKRVRLGPRKKAAYRVRVKVPAASRTGRRFFAACVGRSCRFDRTRVVAPSAPSGPTGPTGPTGPDGPSFSPGAHTAGEPLFPGVGNGGYDAQGYSLELSYDAEENEFLPGTSTTMTAVATQNLSSFSMDFMPQEMEVTEVRVDGQPARFAFEDSPVNEEFAYERAKMVVTPPQGITRGSEFEVRVAYHGYVGHVIDPDGSIEGWIRYCWTGEPGPENPDCYGSYTVSEPVGAMSFFPSNNVARDKATFDTRTTVAERIATPAAPGGTPLVALGTGELVDVESNPDGTNTWIWSEDIPTATYLTTATVGPFEMSEGTVTDPEASPPREITVYDVFDSSATDTELIALEGYFAEQQPILGLLTPVFGPYPIDSGGLVFARASGPTYALENQGKPHFPSLTVDVPILYHEYAHQWFGNTVSPHTWLEIWFNEGWAEWSEWLSEDSTEEEFASHYTDPGFDWGLPPATLNGDPANLFDFDAVYLRPAMALEGYRQIVGDETFSAYAKQLVETFGYGTITTRQAVDLAIEVSGLEGADRELMADYWQQWLYAETRPTILPEDFQVP